MHVHKHAECSFQRRLIHLRKNNDKKRKTEEKLKIPAPTAGLSRAGASALIKAVPLLKCLFGAIVHFLADNVPFKFFLFNLPENRASRPQPPVGNPHPSEQHLAPFSVVGVLLAALKLQTVRKFSLHLGEASSSLAGVVKFGKRAPAQVLARDLVALTIKMRSSERNFRRAK